MVIERELASEETSGPGPFLSMLAASTRLLMSGSYSFSF